jgi:hypothetical protein
MNEIKLDQLENTARKLTDRAKHWNAAADETENRFVPLAEAAVLEARIALNAAEHGWVKASQAPLIKKFLVAHQALQEIDKTAAIVLDEGSIVEMTSKKLIQLRAAGYQLEQELRAMQQTFIVRGIN